MIVFKYEKSGSACFISHIDLLRHVSRIIRRANIPVKFSQGFNPHALVFFSPPLVVGVASRAEYLAIDCDMDEREAFEKYNAAVPEGLRASAVFKCGKNPNLQAKIVAADYVFPTQYTDIKTSDKFEIEYLKKGEKTVENVADKIFSVENFGGQLLIRMAAGNVNLRPDRLLPTLNRMLGADMKIVDVEKVAQYVTSDGKLQDVDGFLKTQ